MNARFKDLKITIKKWITDIDNTDELSSDIKALCFNLYEPYGIEMIGSSWFDEEDEEWACDEDFKPTQRVCPNFNVPDSFTWEEVLEIVISILKELINEVPGLKLFKVEHIAAGFVDRNLIIIK